MNHDDLAVHICHQGGVPYVPALSVGSIWELLEGSAENRGDHPAIDVVDLAAGHRERLTYRERLSYRELRDAVVRCANYLYQAHDVRAGDYVGFVYDNRAEVMVISLAAAILGASCVPLDARRDVVERMAYKMELTGARVLLTHPRGDDAGAWREKTDRLAAILADLPIVVFDDSRSLLDDIAAYEAKPAFPVVDDLDHVQVTLFTSGTTADPKGAQLTGRNLLLNARGIGRWLEIGADDRFGAILPLHHINSTVFSLSTLLAGGTLVLLSEPPRAQFWEAMADLEITITSIVQKMLYRILDLAERHEACRGRLCLRRIQIGSDFVDAAAAEAFVRATGIPLQQGYGLTEVAFRATGVPYGLESNLYLDLLRRNTIGAAIDGSEVSVLTAVGDEAPEGEIGELCMRGPMVMQGYLRNEDATAAAFAGGWFHSGDLGWYERLHGERFFFYHSRQKEIIKKGGAMISPAAIDKAIMAAFPALQDAYAFGYPDPDWGETIWLAVTFDETMGDKQRQSLCAEILRAGRAEAVPGLPRFEAPTRVIDWEATFPDVELPRTSTLKIQRARLRLIVEERLPPASEGG